MRIVVAAIGRLKDGPERTLVARYAERATALGRRSGFVIVQHETDESRARSAAARKTEEAAALLRACPPGGVLIALDEGGEAMTSTAFAAFIGRLRGESCPALVLAVGGPDGLDPALRTRAVRRLAFGAQTWPHQLVRVLLAEQIYRALTILAGHPYHRD